MTDLPPLREVINRHGLFASKALGQNFLFDEQLLDRIARAHPRAADVRAARAEIESLKNADSTYSTHHTVATP